MDELQELKDIKDVLADMIEAARPFLSGDTVTKTSGTIPLIERLDVCIENAERISSDVA